MAAPFANDSTTCGYISVLEEDGDFDATGVGDDIGFRVVVKLKSSARIVEKDGVYLVTAGDDSL